MPAVLRRQATVLFYGAGHSGRDIGCLTPFRLLKFTWSLPVASGGFDPDGNPSTYRAAMQAIHDGRIDANRLISHRYQQLLQLQHAFADDFRRPEYIKGILTRAAD
jgi:threonine dehydrogenase-like Zn-dependent dehydrogenase